MTNRLVNALIALRKACVDVRRAAGNDALTSDLESAATVMSRMMVDETTLPGLRAAALKTYREELPTALTATLQGADYVTLSHNLQERMKQPGGLDAATEKALLAAVASTEMTLLKSYVAAVTQEIQNGLSRQAANEIDDKLDQDALRTYLRSLNADDKALEIVDVRVASRGYSKKTWLVALSGNRVLPSDIVLRVDRPFNYLGTTVLDEFPVLTQLNKAGARVATAYALESTGKVLGNPFIVFSKADGASIGSNFVFPPRNPTLLRDLATCLASIHAVPTDGLPLANMNLSPKGRLSALIDKMYEDWSELHTDVPLIEASFRWLRANIDRGVGPEGLVHGDYSFSNILIAGDRVSAVVDWEFARKANPADDLGYFFFAAEAMGGYDLFLDTYAAAGGKVPPKEVLDYYTVWGQTRLSVMSQQVECGFAAGRWDEIKYGLSAAIHSSQVVVRLGIALERALNG